MRRNRSMHPCQSHFQSSNHASSTSQTGPRRWWGADSWGARATPARLCEVCVSDGVCLALVVSRGAPHIGRPDRPPSQSQVHARDTPHVEPLRAGVCERERRRPGPRGRPPRGARQRLGSGGRRRRKGSTRPSSSIWDGWAAAAADPHVRPAALPRPRAARRGPVHAPRGLPYGRPRRAAAASPALAPGLGRRRPPEQLQFVRARRPSPPSALAAALAAAASGALCWARRGGQRPAHVVLAVLRGDGLCTRGPLRTP
jgi:hypothetical protein